MKVRSKGKVHPSPSSSSSLPSHSPNDDAFSVLKLLPVAILALVSIISLEDKEVLAYMITRFIRSTNPSSTINGNGNSRKKKSKKSSSTTAHHKPPAFDCDCFDCYTSYWFKWDSSPNRELIHQAIEAFEEHLNNGEQSKRNNRGKKRDKMARRHFTDKPPLSAEIFLPEEEPADLPEIEEGFVQVYVNNDAEEEQAEGDGVLPEDVPLPEMAALVVRGTAAIDYKGLARKVLPDVLGLFNSRLWNLWSPNV